MPQQSSFYVSANGFAVCMTLIWVKEREDIDWTVCSSLRCLCVSERIGFIKKIFRVEKGFWMSRNWHSSSVNLHGCRTAWLHWSACTVPEPFFTNCTVCTLHRCLFILLRYLRVFKWCLKSPQQIWTCRGKQYCSEDVYSSQFNRL